jgi:hypothetical protein
MLLLSLIAQAPTRVYVLLGQKSHLFPMNIWKLEGNQLIIIECIINEQMDELKAYSQFLPQAVINK